MVKKYYFDLLLYLIYYINIMTITNAFYKILHYHLKNGNCINYYQYLAVCYLTKKSCIEIFFQSPSSRYRLFD